MAKPEMSICYGNLGGSLAQTYAKVRQGRQRAKFFDDARGSAIECAACLDASVAKGFASLDRIQAGKDRLVRIVAMLTKLLMRFDPEQYRVHDSAAGLAAPFEHEHDDEHD